MRRNSHKQMARFITVCLLLVQQAAAILPLPVPISFNFGGSSPLAVDVACELGSSVHIDGAKQVRQPAACGASTWTWKLQQEGGSELPLGSQASQSQVTLSIGSAAAPGVLPGGPATYLVQLAVKYERCEPELGQTRINVGPCPGQAPPLPPAAAAGAAQAQAQQARFVLQQCKDVAEPGRRTLTLTAPGGGKPAAAAPVAWQLLPLASPSSGGVQAEAGGSKPLACSSAGDCLLPVGAGAGRVQPGRSYVARFSPNGGAQQQQQQAGTKAGSPGALSIGLVGLGLSLDGGSASGGGGAPAPGGELRGLVADKCPPRIGRTTAALMGACGGRRWLEMQASALDVEEGPAGAAGLKYYWYVLSARTQDVVAEASGPLAKLEVVGGQQEGPGRLAEGRRYRVNVMVVTKAGDQTATSRAAVGGVVDVPSC